MKYKWNIKCWMKSGAQIDCVYEGEEANSTQVADKLFGSGAQHASKTFQGLMDSATGLQNIFICAQDLEAFGISVYKEK